MSENSSAEKNSPKFLQIKKKIIKTPHPHFMQGRDYSEHTLSNNSILSFNSADFDSSSYDVKNNLTTDTTFIKQDYSTAERSSNDLRFSIGSRKNTINKKRLTFPTNISDYFINFEELKKKKSSLNVEATIKDISSLSVNKTNESPGQKFEEKEEEGEDSKFTFTFSPGHFNKKIPEVSHPNLPLELKNDEVFKTRLINKLRNGKMLTDTHKFTKNNFNLKRKFSEIYDEKEELEISYGHYPFNKIKKCSSTQKCYHSIFPFYDSENKAHYFNFVKDDDIGITSEWCQYLNDQIVDNDQDTDDETLKNAIGECFESIKLAITDYKTKVDVLNNKMTFKKDMSANIISNDEHHETFQSNSINLN